MKREKNLETMLVITVGLLVLYVIFKSKALLIASLVIGLTGVFSDFLSEKITWVWGKFALILGNINAKILLSAIFFVFLTPIAFIFKLTKKDNLRLKEGKNSVYQDRNHLYESKDLENVW
ncbi:MAG: SxtJ family membrane protein [Flectobacillus sp.]|uniref:SxtJ family membrane protein n=1 Tax=Flectobacillus sp. TaxID=50419 RepID=UPI003B9BF363